MVVPLDFFFKAGIPSLCGMLGYRPTTSAITKKEPSGIFRILFILSIKSPELYIYIYIYIKERQEIVDNLRQIITV